MAHAAGGALQLGRQRGAPRPAKSALKRATFRGNQRAAPGQRAASAGVAAKTQKSACAVTKAWRGRGGGSGRRARSRRRARAARRRRGPPSGPRHYRPSEEVHGRPNRARPTRGPRDDAAAPRTSLPARLLMGNGERSGPGRGKLLGRRVATRQRERPWARHSGASRWGIACRVVVRSAEVWWRCGKDIGRACPRGRKIPWDWFCMGENGWRRMLGERLVSISLNHRD